MKTFAFLSCICALIVHTGCGGRRTVRTLPPGTQARTLTALPPQIEADIITVSQFRSICDQLARNVIVQPFIARAGRPPVVTIRKLENKTGIPIDESIFQETIRATLMEHSGGRVLFRDDVSYRDIIQERARQSGESVTVTLTDSVVSNRAKDGFRQRQLDSGFLSGSADSDEDSHHGEEDSSMEMEQSASVKGGVAQADYFLRGIIYQIKERDSANRSRGMNYFQYQFRVVDARNGLIVWEKMLGTKLEGEYVPVQAQDPQVMPDPNAPPPGPGAGWPPAQGQPGWPGGWTPGQVPGQMPPSGGGGAWPPAGGAGQSPSTNWGPAPGGGTGGR